MKACPMIFNTDMVKALLDGRKVVTRRPLVVPDGWEIKDRKLTKITSSHPKKGKWGALIRQETFDDKYQHDIVTTPCFVGDLIYVRETMDINCYLDMYYLADDTYVEHEPEGWYYKDPEYVGKVPSIHMPRLCSRLTLKVTDVRIEKVQDITPNEVVKEGFNDWTGFAFTWSSIYLNQGLGWDDNPYVWVIEFDVIRSNVDTLMSSEKTAA